MIHRRADNSIDQEFIMEHQALISVAEADWKGSPCWHVFDWMCWKLRCKYWVRSNSVINLDWSGT